MLAVMCPKQYNIASASNSRKDGDLLEDTTPSCTVELRLKTSHTDEMAIDKSFNAGRMLFNACLSEALKRLDLLRQSKAYRKAVAMPKGAEPTEAFKEFGRKQGFKDNSAIQSFAIKCKNAAP